MSINSDNQIITRFPPSPTGRFHVGSARTTLFNYLYAIKNDGKFVLRFEDTDRSRSKIEYEEDIITALAWLGITEYEPPFRQSERSHIYRKYIENMIDNDHAYISNEEPKEAGQNSSVIRFRNPAKSITFTDGIRGEITVDTDDLGDFIIAKSLDEPLYHLAVVIDDYESGVTHVIRGEDHISNTPRQILIQEAIGASRPNYTHIPIVLGPDKSKLSKRHGAKPVLDYKQEGYLSAALVNYLALLGWHPGEGDEQEIFTFQELVDSFDLSRVQKAGAVFSEEKLRWVNKQHLNKLSDRVFFDAVNDWLPNDLKSLPQYSEDRLARLLPEIRERISVYSDLITMSETGELEYFFDSPGYFATDLIWKKSDRGTTLIHLTWLIDNLNSTDTSIWDDRQKIQDVIWPYAEDRGKGDVLWPLRYALSGQDRSPDPLTLLNIFGKEESIKRLEKAKILLEENV